MARPTGVVRHYSDACLFIDLANRTPGRSDVLKALWDDLVAKEPQVIAVTSVLTIAEVAFVASEKQLNQLDAGALRKIDGFWSPSSPVEMVELYVGLAREAREMIRKTISVGQSLKPYDAIHFATARRRGATKFWTYDTKLHTFSGQFGFAVSDPKSEALPFPVTSK